MSPHDADENDDVPHTSKVQARLPGTSLGVIGVGLSRRCAPEGTRKAPLHFELVEGELLCPKQMLQYNLPFLEILFANRRFP